MKISKTLLTPILCLLGLSTAVPPVQAQNSITFDFTGVITSVDDTLGWFQNTYEVGATVTGSYTFFDSNYLSARDFSDPDHSAIYEYYFKPNFLGVPLTNPDFRLRAGDREIRKDTSPFGWDFFWIRTLNDSAQSFPGAGDGYGATSAIGFPPFWRDFSGDPVADPDFFFFPLPIANLSFRDPTSNALSSVALPLMPPNLAAFPERSGSIIILDGNGEPEYATATFRITSLTRACPAVETFATGLLAPSKIIQSPLGNFIVAEGGPEVPNNGRVSIVDQQGNRRTLIDGLPSARTFVGDFNGTTGVWLDGRTLYVLNGQGDVTLPGPVPGTEVANPTPASPIFSSVLAVQFSGAMEDTTSGVTLTLADHQALKAGQRLTRSDAKGHKMLIELIADFPDYKPEPRPNFAANVRHSHPYGLVGEGQQLYIIDAGFNIVRKVDARRGTTETLASFAPTPNPRFPAGPPVLENVPTSIRWDGHDLLVTLLSGGPFFLPGYSTIQQVDPRTGGITPLINGLSSAIDVAPLGARGRDESFLSLEHNLTFPTPGPGRIQSFSSASGNTVVLADCLTTPTSMVLDRKGDRIVITELSTGRLMTLRLP
jgi:hypothetical protein